MDAAQLARVRFLVREDAWAAWEKLGQPDSVLDMALTEYRDLRLVAAYVLETVCADLRHKDAEAAAVAGGQTKSYEAVGEWKEEFFAPATSADSVAAEDYCRRAAALCAQVAADGREARRLGTMSVPVEAGF